MSTSSDAPVASPPRGGVLGSYVDGWARTLRAPVIIVGALTATLLFATPFRSLSDGGDWSSELTARVEYIVDTITYETLVLAGTFRSASDLLAPQDLPPWIAGPTAGCLLLWLFLSGGVLDRLARGRPVRTAAFFAACGGYFFRLLRLSLITGLGYWTLLHWAAGWVASPVYGGILAAAAAIILVVSEFARARLVVEDRRSAAGALVAALRFVRRRPMRIAGLVVLHTIVLVVIANAWALRPDVLTTGLALATSVPYLLVRLVARLAFIAAQVSFFQGELAHSRYTAAPLPIWPDSPSAEAIDNFLQRRDKLPPS